MNCSTTCCTSGLDAKKQGRKFLTKEEKMLTLEEYQEWLKNESQGVNEAIAKLKNK